ncbi:MAG TPA: XRE family transcriptional regulator [Lachnospiraceae bacterium]|jgi:predicted transcriptional regulator|nr:XRE family transcriptional regulator [Lachnospiraceae bacterium]
MQPYQIVSDITELRRSRGISQHELANITGIKQPVIARMEKGTTNPRLDTVIKIVEALDYELKIVPKKNIK